MIKLENANNLKTGDKVLMVETIYNFNGTVEKEYKHELLVIRNNKKTVTVDDLTYNMGYKLLKDYQFGKINMGIKHEYYLI